MDRGGRPELVFVPGFMQRGDAWRPVAERLAGRYRSTCLDHQTHTFSARIEEILAATGPNTLLVGYSMGGRLTLHAALARPHALAGVVVVGTSAGIDSDVEREERRQTDERLAQWMEATPIEETVERWESLAVFASQSTELREALRPGRLSHDPAGLAALLRSAGQGSLPPVWHRLGEISCPLLAVAGEADDAYVAAAYRLADLTPGGAATLLPGAGHAPQLEQPDGFARLLERFVEERVTAQAAGSEACE